MTAGEHVSKSMHNLRRAMRAHRLLVALLAAIGAALLLTLVSLTIYKLGGFYRYDLSRPGFEKERTEISTTPTDLTFDTTSPLTNKAIATFLQQLDANRHNLETYNTFGNGGLSDEDLQLTPNQVSAPQ
jgi:hypothetical protein